MRFCCMSVDTVNLHFIQILGVMCIFFGISLIVINASPYGYVTSEDEGDWWYAIFILFTGLLCQCSKTRRMLTFNLIMSFVTMVVTIVGTASLFDKYVNVFKEMQACYNPQHNIYYGNSDYQKDTFQCYNTTITTADTTASYDCYCKTSSDEKKCYNYHLASDNHCSNIIDTHKQTLLISVILNIFTVFILSAIMIITLITLFSDQDITVCCNSAPLIHRHEPKPFIGILDFSDHREEPGEHPQHFHPHHHAADIEKADPDSHTIRPLKPKERQKEFIHMMRDRIVEANDLYEAMQDHPHYDEEQKKEECSGWDCLTTEQRLHRHDQLDQLKERYDKAESV